MALPLANTAEGVTTGTALTTTLSASGGNAFDTVTQGTGATLQASTVQASNGTTSYRIVQSATFANTRVVWALASVGTLTDIYGRMYVWMSANPTATMAIAQHMTGSRMGSVAITTTGKLQWISSVAVLAGSPTTATVPLSSWFRVEWRYTVTGANAANGTIYYFNNAAVESATPTETLASGAMTANSQSNFTQLQIGQNEGGIPSGTMYMDSIALSGTGLPGPAAGAAAVVPELVMAPRIPSY